MSSIGLGFLIGTEYLLPITSVFLTLTLVVFGFRAKERRGYGPFLVGASAALLIGKFYLESNPLIYGGVGLLVVASVWKGWPRRTSTAAPEWYPSSGLPEEELIPSNPDERGLFALRLVVERCLYGVDRNRLAVEMAKLSLWLLTLTGPRSWRIRFCSRWPVRLS